MVSGPGGVGLAPGMVWTLSRGRVAAMNWRQMAAGVAPPVTRFIGVLSSRPVQTAVVKPPV